MGKSTNKASPMRLHLHSPDEETCSGINAIACSMDEEAIADVLHVKGVPCPEAHREMISLDEVANITCDQYGIRFRGVTSLICLYDLPKSYTGSTEVAARIVGSIVDGKPVIERIDAETRPCDAILRHSRLPPDRDNPFKWA